MISALTAAWAICTLTNWRTSNLVLQKKLYIAHGAYMAGKSSHLSPLIGSRFFAWDLGPVVPSLYHELKTFGSDPVASYSLAFALNEFDRSGTGEEITHIKEILDVLAERTSTELVHMTHAMDGAWNKNYKPYKSRVIPDKDIYDEYMRYGTEQSTSS